MPTRMTLRDFHPYLAEPFGYGIVTDGSDGLVASVAFTQRELQLLLGSKTFQRLIDDVIMHRLRDAAGEMEFVAERLMVNEDTE